ncbi:MAG: hypothetical protein V5B78_03295 [Desulfohalobiaceae bacterium]
MFASSALGDEGKGFELLPDTIFRPAIVREHFIRICEDQIPDAFEIELFGSGFSIGKKGIRSPFPEDKDVFRFQDLYSLPEESGIRNDILILKKAVGPEGIRCLGPGKAGKHIRKKIPALAVFLARTVTTVETELIIGKNGLAWRVEGL